MDQTIDVRIRAQTAELKTGLNQAAAITQDAAQAMRQSLASATSGMMRSMSQTSTHIATAGSAMSNTMKVATDSIKMSVAQMGGAFSNLFTWLAKTPAQLGLVAAAFGGLVAIKKGVSDTLAFTEASMDLGRALGISASQASILKIASLDLGFSQGELESAAKGLTRQIKTNEAAMNRMGLETRDSNGQFKSLDILMSEGIGLLQNYKAGTDRNIAAQTLFGRGLDTSSKLMLLTGQKYKELEAMARSLGLEVGERSVAAWNKFDDAIDTVKFLFQAIFKIIGDMVIPVFNELAIILREELPGAIKLFRGAMAALMTVVNAVLAVFMQLRELMVALYHTVTTVAVSLGQALAKALVGDFAGAAKAIADAGNKITHEWAKRFGNMEKISQETRTRITHLWSRDTPIPKAPDGNKSAANKGGEKEAGGGGLVAAWEGELDRMRLTFDEMKGIEGSFQAYSIAEEYRFWQAKLALTHQGSEDNIAVRQKMAALAKSLHEAAFQEEIKQLHHQLANAKNNETQKIAIIEQEVALTLKAYGRGSKEYEAIENKRLAIVEKAAMQRLTIAQKLVERQTAYRYAQLDAEEEVAQLSYALAQISQANLLQQQAQFEAKRYAVAHEAANNHLRTIDPDKDPVNYAEQALAIEQIEQDHQAKMRDIKHQLTVEQNQPELAIFSAMQSGFENAILSMTTRAQSFASIMSALFKDIYKVFLMEMSVKPLAEIAARFAKEQILHRMIGLFQIGTQAQASAVVASLKRAEAGQVVAANAAEGASGAAASQAAIPLVGPALGTAAAIAMFAFVMGFLGKGGGSATTTTRTVASAAGGFDIPEGLNPVTQLHEKEMVLPAEHAQTIRNLKGSNVAFEALNFHITTMDSKGVKEFLLNNKMALAESLKSALRDFKA